MKPFRLAFLCLTVASMLPSVTSCKSDESPFNWTVSDKTANATIRLHLNVADTRADDLSTDQEKAIKKVTIHIFNEKQELEATKNVDITAGEKTVTLEVSKGLKTLYVVSAKSNVNPSVGISLSDYQNSVFVSTLANLNTADGFVMVGKSKEQMVMVSASKDDLPASNVFDIKLERLVAKAQVKRGNIDGSKFGISFGNASFKAFQLNQRMRVLHNGSDVFDSNSSTFVDSNNNGTYDNYSLGAGDYLNAVTTDFSADGCAYMSENIVSIPKSGNTTFLSIRFATTPLKYYTFGVADQSPVVSDETPVAATTYYAVGIQDKANGMVDYALESASGHIVTFKSPDDAERYMNSLNGGETSAITVSQTESAMKAPGVSAEASEGPKFEVITFADGYAYYRVNIAHQDTSGDSDKSVIKVMRNKFYKVNINSVTGLGFGSEALLRPGNPEAVLDAEGHSWISASVSVADWDVVTQDVDL